MRTARQLLHDSWALPIIVGHRGAAAYAPENSLKAFELALEKRVELVECDVHLSADGVPVVIHDATVDRTTRGTGPVAGYTAADLSRLGVPSLAEVLATLEGRAVLAIELKAGEGVASASRSEVERAGAEEAVMYFSFSETLLPNLRPRVLLCTSLEHAKRAREMDGLGLHYSLVTDLSWRTSPVFVWTVPPGDEWQRLVHLGVNFVITDHPFEESS